MIWMVSSILLYSTRTSTFTNEFFFFGLLRSMCIYIFYVAAFHPALAAFAASQPTGNCISKMIAQQAHLDMISVSFSIDVLWYILYCGVWFQWLGRLTGDRLRVTLENSAPDSIVIQDAKSSGNSRMEEIKCSLMCWFFTTVEGHRSARVTLNVSPARG